jgi:predicted nuclease of predicted toxin-antitoxin system
VARQKRPSSSSSPRVQPHQFKLLIDENLTPDLVKVARSRGFVARYVNEANLRTTSDKAVAHYALRGSFIVVTNNMVDLRALYAHKRMHPGLIFLTSVEEESFTRVNQASLFNIALDEILAKDILQEVVLVRLLGEDGGDINYELTRHELPKH